MMKKNLQILAVFVCALRMSGEPAEDLGQKGKPDQGRFVMNLNSTTTPSLSSDQITDLPKIELPKDLEATHQAEASQMRAFSFPALNTAKFFSNMPVIVPDGFVDEAMVRKPPTDRSYMLRIIGLNDLPFENLASDGYHFQ